MKIKAKRSFVLRDKDTGRLKSFAYGDVVELDDSIAKSLIDIEFAEKYTLVAPSGTLKVDVGGTYDVTNYEFVESNVQKIVTIRYDPNGGTGVIAAKEMPKGSIYELPDGSDFEPPEGKTFVIGWSESPEDGAPMVSRMYKADKSVKLYAVWTDVQP